MPKKFNIQENNKNNNNGVIISCWPTSALMLYNILICFRITILRDGNSTARRNIDFEKIIQQKQKFASNKLICIENSQIITHGCAQE